MKRIKGIAVLLCLGVGFSACENSGGDDDKVDVGGGMTTVGDILKKAPDGGYMLPEVLPDAALALLAMDLRLENLLDAIVVIPPRPITPDMTAPRPDAVPGVDRSPDVTMTMMMPAVRLDMGPVVAVDAVPDGQPVAVDVAPATPDVSPDVTEPTPDMTPDLVISLPDMAMMSPPDAAPVGTACTSAANCDDKNPCTVDSCTAGVCGYAVAPMVTSCRVAKGACDRPEYCDGTTTVCPADRLQAAGTVCGPAPFINDSRENNIVVPHCSAPVCSGVGTFCPAPSCFQPPPQEEEEGIYQP